MNDRSNDERGHGRHIEVIVFATRESIVERLADPYLTDHDRWVLRQFGRFLSGIAPEPDRRVGRIEAPRSSVDRR
ncbi:MAG: hypothetical protein AB1Z67_08160 [Candidatus Limnocylindrales bacterium]